MIEQIDIRSDERFTYGMRIELGKILSDEQRTDFEKYEQSMLCVYGVKPTPREYVKMFSYFEGIIEGLRYWVDAETNMLHSTPSADEIAAGVEQYSSVGELATIVQLAKDFHVFPNDILKRPYSEIFSILLVEREKSDFERRLNDVIRKKTKWSK